MNTEPNNLGVNPPENNFPNQVPPVESNGTVDLSKMIENQSKPNSVVDPTPVVEPVNEINSFSSPTPVGEPSPVVEPTPMMDEPQIPSNPTPPVPPTNNQMFTGSFDMPAPSNNVNTSSEPMNNTTMEPTSVNPEPIVPVKKSSASKAIIAILVIAIIAVAGVFAYLKFFKKGTTPTTAKEYYASLVNSLSSNFGNAMTKLKSDSMNGDVSVKINTTESDNDLLNFISNFDVKFSYGVNGADLTTLLELDTKYKSQDLFNGKVYITKDKLYLTITDILDKYLYTDFSSEGFEIQTTDISKYSRLFEIMINTISDNITDEYLIVEENNGEMKLILSLDSPTKYKAFFKKVMSDLKNNSELVSLAAEINGSSNETVISDLNSAFDDTEDITMEITVYTKGYNKMPTRIQLTSTVEDKYDEGPANEEKIDITNITTNSFSYTIEEGSEKITGNFATKDISGGKNVTFDVTDEGTTISISANQKYGTGFTVPNIAGAIPFEDFDITDETLMQKITNNSVFQTLIEDAQKAGLINNDDSGYDDDYDDYYYDDDEYEF